MPDRPTNPAEIEVTPAMLETGAEAMRGFDGGYLVTSSEGAARVYRVMETARVAGLDAAFLALESEA
jgi:hypothetical protein